MEQKYGLTGETARKLYGSTSSDGVAERVSDALHKAGEYMHKATQDVVEYVRNGGCCKDLGLEKDENDEAKNDDWGEMNKDEARRGASASNFEKNIYSYELDNKNGFGISIDTDSFEKTNGEKKNGIKSWPTYERRF